MEELSGTVRVTQQRHTLVTSRNPLLHTSILVAGILFAAKLKEQAVDGVEFLFSAQNSVLKCVTGFRVEKTHRWQQVNFIHNLNALVNRRTCTALKHKGSD